MISSWKPEKLKTRIRLKVGQAWIIICTHFFIIYTVIGLHETLQCKLVPQFSSKNMLGNLSKDIDMDLVPEISFSCLLKVASGGKKGRFPIVTDLQIKV